MGRAAFLLLLLAACAGRRTPTGDMEQLALEIEALRAVIEGRADGHPGHVLEVHEDLIRFVRGDIREGQRLVLEHDGVRVGTAEVYHARGRTAWAVVSGEVPKPGDLVYARRP